MKKTLYVTYCILLCVVLFIPVKSVQAQEQVLLGWQFFNSGKGTDGVSTGNEAKYNATNTYEGVNVSVLTRGKGLTAYALLKGFSSQPSGEAVDSLASISANSFYEFKFQTKANYKASLTTLNAKLRLAGRWYAPSAEDKRLYCQWKYSIDGGKTFISIGKQLSFNAPTITSGEVQAPIDIASIANLQGIQSKTEVVFRLYAWGFSNGMSGTLGVGRSISESDYSLSLLGTVVK